MAHAQMGRNAERGPGDSGPAPAGRVVPSRRRSPAAAARRLVVLSGRFVRGFFGPVFEVDLRSCSRQKRTFFLRAVYLGLLIFVVGLAWQQSVVTARYNPAQGMLSLGMLAPTLLVVCGWFQLIALALLGPALTSGALLLERTRRTLPVLLTTPLPAWDIVASKLMSRSMQLLVLAGLTLPVVASVQAFGGIETVDVLGTLGLGIVNGLFAASVGLAVSTHATTPQRATLTSYFVLAGVYLMVPAFFGWAGMFLVAVVGLLFAPWFDFGSIGIALAASINPFASMIAIHTEVFSPGALGVAGLWGGKLWLWVPNLLLLLAGTWVMLVLAAGRLRRLADSDPTIRHVIENAGTTAIDLTAAAGHARKQLGGRSRRSTATPTENPSHEPAAGVPDGGQPLEPAAPRVPVAIVSTALPDKPATAQHDDHPRGPAPSDRREDPRPRNTSGSAGRSAIPLVMGSRGQKSRPVGDNPILWRELNRRRSQQTGWTWVALGISAYLLLLVYLPAGFSGNWASGSFHGAMTTLYLLVLLVATAALAGPSIAVEKEASCWPLLLGTPLTGWQILSSKARVVLRRVYPFSLFLVGHLVVFTLFGCLHPVVLVHGVMIVAASTSFLLVTGMWLSLRVKGSTRATVATFLVGLVLWLLLPALVNTISEITESRTTATEVSWLINPFNLLLQAASGAARDRPHRTFAAPSTGHFTIALFLVSGGYLLAAAGLVAYFVRRFNSLVGRTS